VLQSGMNSNKKNSNFKISTNKNQTQKKVNLDSQPNAAFNWFPGHMMKAMREIKAKVQMVDLVIEIRDARVPLASGNQALIETIEGKARIIVLNKVNLADTAMIEKWDAWFKEQGVPYLFVNALKKSEMKNVLQMGRKIIEERRQASNEGIEAKGKYRFMIIGLPNTGKSTFINTFAKRNATKVADKPGQTRIQLWVDVDEDLQLLDTPGVMPPMVRIEEHRFWLSLINAIPDEIIGEEDPACYLVKYFLKNKSETFKAKYKLDSFDLSIDEALHKIAVARGCIRQKGLPDLERVFKLLLNDFRAGELGKVCFQNPPEKK
jgi:ribosome biogenesis GTPase A